MSEEAESLATDGFVLLPGLCDAEFVDRILAVARDRIAEVMPKLGRDEIGIGSAAGYEEVVQRSPGRWDLPISPQRFGTRDKELPWWPLVAELLGADAEHSFSGIVYSDPGSPEQCWHIDSPHLDHAMRPAHALNVLVALHDIPMAMGPTQMAVGSQQLTNHYRNPGLVCEQLIYQNADTSPELLVKRSELAAPGRWAEPLTAGSCLVFDDRILHRGLANRSESERYVAYFSYRQAGYSENTHFESNRSLFAEGVRKTGRNRGDRG